MAPSLAGVDHCVTCCTSFGRPLEGNRNYSQQERVLRGIQGWMFQRVLVFWRSRDEGVLKTLKLSRNLCLIETRMQGGEKGRIHTGHTYTDTTTEQKRLASVNTKYGPPHLRTYLISLLSQGFFVEGRFLHPGEVLRFEVPGLAHEGRLEAGDVQRGVDGPVVPRRQQRHDPVCCFVVCDRVERISQEADRNQQRQEEKKNSSTILTTNSSNSSWVGWVVCVRCVC